MGLAATALRNRAIARCEGAWALSMLGTWSFAIVLALYAYYEHGPAGVALAVAARMVPAALLAGLPALVARRWSRRSAVIVSALVRFATVEAIALVAALDASFVLLLALAAAFEIAGGLHLAARAELVLESAGTPEDLGALGLSPMVNSAGMIAGAVCAGLALVTVSLEAAFAIAGAAFLPAGLLAWRLPRTADAQPSPDGEPLRLWPAFRISGTGRLPRLRVGVFGAAVLFDSTLDLLLVVAALDLLHTSDGGVGWLRAAFAGGGLVIGAAAASRRPGRLAIAAASGLALAGLPLALVPAWPAVVPALLLIAVLGAGYALLEFSLQDLTLRLVSGQVAAGMASIENYVYPLARAVGAGLAAWLVVELGDAGAMIMVGMLLPAVALLAMRPLRRAEAGAPVPERVLELIRGLPVLAALPAPAIATLARHASRECFEAGAALLQPDEVAAKLFVIEQGMVQRSAPDGSARQLGPGTCFGEAAILRDSRQRMTITALTAVQLWSIARHDFIRCVGGPARAPSVASRRRETREVARV